MTVSFFLLRHGETVWNAAGRLQGALNSPLTARGEAQARAMGRALAALGVSGASHRWISSPSGRAVQTATLARGAAPDTLDARLAEIGMGDWTGLTLKDIAARWPGPSDEALMDFYARIPGGESFESAAARARAVLSDLSAPAVIVTHGITSRFLRGAVLGLPPSALGALPGGHGVVFHCTANRVDLVASVCTLPEPPAGGIATV